MNTKIRIFYHDVIVAVFFTISFAMLSACGGGGGGGCDMIANPSGPAYFQVTNAMSNGLRWSFVNSYAFGADMKPGECTKMGVAASQYEVEFQRCVISDAACTSTYGITKTIMFTVSAGDTYSVTVDDAFFN